jgi:hypothetical protein
MRLGETARVRLAPALDPGLFSEAERSALLLDGECRPLGLTIVPVDVPDGPVVRAASLSGGTARHDLVVELRTAAWVHGAIPAMPHPLTLAVDVRRSPRTKRYSPAPREARFRAEDTERLGGVLVTTPLKTAYDLLRLDGSADAEVEAIAARLLQIAGLSPLIAAALAQLQLGAPHKQRGIDRLAALPR